MENLYFAASQASYPIKPKTPAGITYEYHRATPEAIINAVKDNKVLNHAYKIVNKSRSSKTPEWIGPFEPAENGFFPVAVNVSREWFCGSCFVALDMEGYEVPVGPDQEETFRKSNNYRIISLAELLTRMEEQKLPMPTIANESASDRQVGDKGYKGYRYHLIYLFNRYMDWDEHEKVYWQLTNMIYEATGALTKDHCGRTPTQHIYSSHREDSLIWSSDNVYAPDDFNEYPARRLWRDEEGHVTEKLKHDKTEYATAQPMSNLFPDDDPENELLATFVNGTMNWEGFVEYGTETWRLEHIIYDNRWQFDFGDKDWYVLQPHEHLYEVYCYFNGGRKVRLKNGQRRRRACAQAAKQLYAILPPQIRTKGQLLVMLVEWMCANIDNADHSDIINRYEIIGFVEDAFMKRERARVSGSRDKNGTWHEKRIILKKGLTRPEIMSALWNGRREHNLLYLAEHYNRALSIEENWTRLKAHNHLLQWNECYWYGNGRCNGACRTPHRNTVKYRGSTEKVKSQAAEREEKVFALLSAKPDMKWQELCKQCEEEGITGVSSRASACRYIKAYKEGKHKASKTTVGGYVYLSRTGHTTVGETETQYGNDYDDYSDYDEYEAPSVYAKMMMDREEDFRRKYLYGDYLPIRYKQETHKPIKQDLDIFFQPIEQQPSTAIDISGALEWLASL